MPGRILAIGDIHGCDVALEVMLAELHPTADDVVVVLGDVVDRGPDSRRCVDQLLDLKQSTNLVFLMGNHEEMFLDAIDGGEWQQDWLNYGGAETLKSYGNDLSKLPEAHVEFFRAGLDLHQTSHEIFVHANLQPRLPLERQPGQWLRWTHLQGTEQPHDTGKRIVCGHTRLPDGVPAVLAGWVCIDTFACGGQFLTCLDVKENVVHQSTQAGEF
ncbi:MAG: metallophosphoesterase [Planctomycetes bacterium]|nr:metallophosphoesterase [Planctomycetota bacterium]